LQHEWFWPCYLWVHIHIVVLHAEAVV